MNKALGKPSTQTYKKTIGQVLSNEVMYEGLSGGAKLSLTQAGLSLINSGDSQTGINETMDPQKLESNPNENDESPTMTMDEFKELVLKLVGRNTVRLSELGQRIIQYQRENEWIQTGKSATNKASDYRQRSLTGKPSKITKTKLLLRRGEHGEIVPDLYRTLPHQYR